MDVAFHCRAEVMKVQPVAAGELLPERLGDLDCPGAEVDISLLLERPCEPPCSVRLGFTSCAPCKVQPYGCGVGVGVGFLSFKTFHISWLPKLCSVRGSAISSNLKALSLALPFTVLEWTLPMAPRLAQNGPSRQSSSKDHTASDSPPDTSSTKESVANSKASSSEGTDEDTFESFAFALVNGALGVFEVHGRRIRDFRNGSETEWRNFVFDPFLITNGSETEIMHSVNDPLLIGNRSETKFFHSVSVPSLITNGSEMKIMFSVSDSLLIRDGTETEWKNFISDPFLISNGSET
ncbi:hypothetical protein Syun_009257 [Stephania yunnanensis]|uniref:WDR11 second beta-propeller domain-containing protein n=1 Tax=Stephania yunnanensis TaxID=152371 RepID=A0AAP0KFU5_9MAGN